MKFLIPFLLFFSLNVSAEDQFFCEASAILKFDVTGFVEKNELTKDLAVIIEGSLFVVKKEDVVEFISEETSKGFEHSLLVEEKESGYWIDLKTLNGKGKISTDYRGITLNNNDVTCNP